MLLVTVSALRADHTSMLLYPRATTAVAPTAVELAAEQRFGLDDLAAEGVLFASAFAPSPDPWASLIALATGRSPLATGVLGPEDPLAADERTLAETFARAGFATAAFVACADSRAPQGWERGFEEASLEADDDAVMARAVHWVGRGAAFERGKSLLWLHLEGPRPPFDPPSLAGAPDFATRFEDDGLPDGAVARYDGEVARVTQLLRRFFAYWSHAGHEVDAWRDTLVVFAGASGLARLDEREPDATAAPSDAALHVPLFLRHPRSLTGRRVFADVVQLEDVLPTLLDWLRLERPPALGGRSLAPRTDEYLRRRLPAAPAFAVDRAGSCLSARGAHWRALFTASSSSSPELEPVHTPTASAGQDVGRAEAAERLTRATRAWIRSQVLAPRCSAFAGLASP